MDSSRYPGGYDAPSWGYPPVYMGITALDSQGHLLFRTPAIVAAAVPEAVMVPAAPIMYSVSYGGGGYNYRAALRRDGPEAFDPSWYQNFYRGYGGEHGGEFMQPQHEYGMDTCQGHDGHIEIDEQAEDGYEEGEDEEEAEEAMMEGHGDEAEGYGEEDGVYGEEGEPYDEYNEEYGEDEEYGDGSELGVAGAAAAGAISAASDTVWTLTAAAGAAARRDAAATHLAGQAAAPSSRTSALKLNPDAPSFPGLHPGAPVFQKRSSDTQPSLQPNAAEAASFAGLNPTARVFVAGAAKESLAAAPPSSTAAAAFTNMNPGAPAFRQQGSGAAATLARLNPSAVAFVPPPKTAGTTRTASSGGDDVPAAVPEAGERPAASGQPPAAPQAQLQAGRSPWGAEGAPLYDDCASGPAFTASACAAIYLEEVEDAAGAAAKGPPSDSGNTNAAARGVAGSEPGRDAAGREGRTVSGSRQGAGAGEGEPSAVTSRRCSGAQRPAGEGSSRGDRGNEGTSAPAGLAAAEAAGEATEGASGAAGMGPRAEQPRSAVGGLSAALSPAGPTAQCPGRAPGRPSTTSEAAGDSGASTAASVAGDMPTTTVARPCVGLAGTCAPAADCNGCGSSADSHPSTQRPPPSGEGCVPSQLATAEMTAAEAPGEATAVAAKPASQLQEREPGSGARKGGAVAVAAVEAAEGVPSFIAPAGPALPQQRAGKAAAAATERPGPSGPAPDGANGASELQQPQPPQTPEAGTAPEAAGGATGAVKAPGGKEQSRLRALPIPVPLAVPNWAEANGGAVVVFKAASSGQQQPALDSQRGIDPQQQQQAPLNLRMLPPTQPPFRQFVTCIFRLFQGHRAEHLGAAWWCMEPENAASEADGREAAGGGVGAASSSFNNDEETAASSCSSHNVLGPYSCEQMILAYIAQLLPHQLLVCGTQVGTGSAGLLCAPPPETFLPLGDLLAEAEAGQEYVLRPIVRVSA